MGTVTVRNKVERLAHPVAGIQKVVSRALGAEWIAILHPSYFRLRMVRSPNKTRFIGSDYINREQHKFLWGFLEVAAERPLEAYRIFSGLYQRESRYKEFLGGSQDFDALAAEFAQEVA